MNMDVDMSQDALPEGAVLIDRRVHYPRSASEHTSKSGFVPYVRSRSIIKFSLAAARMLFVKDHSPYTNLWLKRIRSTGEVS